MGRFKEEFKLLDSLFKSEREITNNSWREVIAETFLAAQNKKLPVHEVAHRRFRRREFYIKTCLAMFISPAKYYRLLRIFFKLAQKSIEKIFKNENRNSVLNVTILRGIIS